MLNFILFVTLVINYGLDQKTRNLRNVINDYERTERASRNLFRFSVKIIHSYDNNNGNDYTLYCKKNLYNFTANLASAESPEILM